MYYIISINIKINRPLFYIMPKRHFSKTRKYRKYRRKGGDGGEGQDYDIEQGPVIPVVPLRRIPTDPIRKREELGRNFTKSMPVHSVHKVMNDFNRFAYLNFVVLKNK